MMKLFIILVLINGINSLKIRGVPDKYAEDYKPDENGLWRCLSNPEIILSIDKINDNYCDCPDGSDEPGTNACDNGLFYCENIGFESNFIPSYKVNDGICDYDVCCDGSDEIDGLCENKCIEMKLDHDKYVKESNENVTKGLKLKGDILQRSINERNRLDNEIQRSNDKLRKLKENIELLNIEKIKLNENEKFLLEKFDIIENDVDSLSSSFLNSMNKMNNYVSKLEDLEHILQRMTLEYNHNFNDPAVKDAAESYLNFAASIDDDNNAENTVNRVKLSEIIGNFNEVLSRTKFDLNKIKEEMIQFTKDDKKKDNVEKSHNIWDIILNSFIGYFENVDTLETVENLSDVEIDNKINKLNKDIKNLKTKIRQSEIELNKNFGPDDILRSMNECYTKTMGKFEYKFCPNSKIEQVEKDGRTMKIGFFNDVEVIDNLGKFNINFTKGERCWDGPIREAVAELICDVKTEILSVTEPQKCMYHFKISSPIACFESDLL